MSSGKRSAYTSYWLLVLNQDQLALLREQVNGSGLNGCVQQEIELNPEHAMLRLSAQEMGQLHATLLEKAPEDLAAGKLLRQLMEQVRNQLDLL